MRLVVDVNVLLSSLMGGELADLQNMLADERFEVFTSYEQLAELLDVMERPKFRKYFSLAEARALVADFTLIAEWIDRDPPEQLGWRVHTRKVSGMHLIQDHRVVDRLDGPRQTPAHIKILSCELLIRPLHGSSAGSLETIPASTS